MDVTRIASDEEPPPDGLLCSCGRVAVVAYDTERFGVVGYCGVPGRYPLDPCDCGGPHDRAWCAARSLASKDVRGVVDGVEQR